MKKNNVLTYIIRLLLIVMIILSIVLMVKISVNIGNINQIKTPSTSVSDSLRDEKKLLLPTAMYHHEQETIYDVSKESLALKVMNQLSDMTFYEKKKTMRLPLSDIKEWQRFANGIEMNYTTPIAFSYINSIYHFNLERHLPNIKVTDLWLNCDTKELLLLNRQTKEGYLYGLKGNWKRLKEIITKEENHRYEMASVSDDYLGYLLKKEETVPIYTYMMSFQPYTNVTQSLFDNPSNVTTSGDEHHIIFSDERDEEMRLNNNNGVISLVKNIDQAPEDALLDSLSLVSRLGNDFGELRFMEGTEDTYRYYVFVEGYPIFTDYYRGQVEVDITKRYVKMMMNQETIHVPVPETKKVTLLSGKEVMARLKEKHIHLDRLDRIQLGYQWKEVKGETQSAVQLIPSWFIHYDNDWLTLDEILKGER